ncbi:MAG: AAA family ATPase [Candidatus Caenarcaniphilales bacterium]|nr:AAA family ATPase [Candidatus Caenarcaniphilales bacterium]
MPIPAKNSKNDHELDKLLVLLPARIMGTIAQFGDREKLIEVVMDLGRQPELRFHGSEPVILPDIVTQDEIDFMCRSLSGFSSENRAGIEKTLHRISAIRNRRNEIIGLTCRVGKTLTGTIDIIADLLEQNKSILLLGPPGCGKTTRLREIAQTFADRYLKRVIIVDTSNEIGGDGDIPHPSIGRARRMPVIDPSQQHKVMIEAVENHTPEVIVIDEISTMEEAVAAQTIAERGVILVATAHGRDLESVVKNPALSVLVGAPQSVTLSDEEAKRRKSQKSILERAREATFQIAVEIVSHQSVVIHPNVDQAVDEILHGGVPIMSEVRNSKEHTRNSTEFESPFKVYPYAVSHSQILAVVKALDLPVILVDSIEEADIIIALEDYAAPGAKIHNLAAMLNLELATIETNSFSEIKSVLSKVFQEMIGEDDPIEMELEMQIGLDEAHQAIEQYRATGETIELNPRKSSVRRAQKELIEQSGFNTEIIGEGIEQRLKLG